MAALGSPQDRLYGSPDWGVLGLILCIVGCFLLANGILFRDTRGLLRERFGGERPSLRTIRDFVFHRVQMALGFAFLLMGFGLQLFGHSIPAPDPGSRGSQALWIGLVVLLVIVLEFAGWWWSLISFRRHLREWFRSYPPDFESDTRMAREVGDLFGIASHAEDTVQSFVERLRKAVGLPPPLRPTARRREPEGDALE